MNYVLSAYSTNASNSVVPTVINILVEESLFMQKMYKTINSINEDKGIKKLGLTRLILTRLIIFWCPIKSGYKENVEILQNALYKNIKYNDSINYGHQQVFKYIQVKQMNQYERVFSKDQKDEKTDYTDRPSEEPSECTLQQTQTAKQHVKKEIGGRKEIKTDIQDLGYVLATYIPVRIIEQVENNDTRGCNYLLFHLPFTLLLCDTLQLHPSPGSTLLRDILLQQLKRIKDIDAQPPRQFGPEEVMSVVASAANFQKVPMGHFLRELGRFVERHAVKLQTFMPYYAAMFRLVLRRESYLGKVECVGDLDALFSATKAEVRAKYHNFDLQ